MLKTTNYQELKERARDEAISLTNYKYYGEKTPDTATIQVLLRENSRYRSNSIALLG